MPCGLPRSDETTFAVLRATPGRRRSASKSVGTSPPYSSMQHLHRAAQRLRLLAVEAGGEDVALELLLRHREVVLGRRYFSNSVSVTRFTFTSVVCAESITDTRARAGCGT
jgi:hypothetical protein